MLSVTLSSIRAFSLGVFLIVLGGGLSIGSLFGFEGREMNYALYFLSSLIILVLPLKNKLNGTTYRSGCVWVLVVFYGYVVARSDLFTTFESTVKTIAYVLVPFVAYRSSQIWTLNEFFEILCVAIYWVVISSLIMLVFFPDLAISEFARGTGLGGIYSQKNSLGRMLSLLIIILLIKSRVKFIPLAILVIVSVVLVYSNSRTSLYLSLSIAFVIYYIRMRGTIFFASVLLLVFTVLLIYLDTVYDFIELDNLNYALTIFSYEIDLTGRLPIWSYLWSLFEPNAVFGIGYNGVWSLSYELGIEHALGWHLTDSHNGYLEVALQLGIIGLFFFAIVLTCFIKALVFYSKIGLEERLFSVSIFLYIFIINFTSSNFLEVFSIIPFLICFIIFSSSRNAEYAA
jgi:O-antigen ligase